MAIRCGTPKSFADAFTTDFTKVVNEAAGKDGRLSKSEAARIATRPDGGKVFADDALSFFEQSGQKSVAAAKLIGLEHDAALAEATVAAGHDGKLSKADAQKLPAYFRDDFSALRVGPLTSSRTPAELAADVTEAALRSFDAGTATKLSGPPAALRGLNPVASGVAHDASGTRLDVYVAGDTIYASRASDTPSPLVGFYRVGQVPAEGTGRAALRSAVDAATQDLWLTSESDARVRFVLGEDIGQAPITEALVRSKLGGAHDTLGPSLYGYQDSEFVKLADRTAEPVGDGKAWLDARASNFDPNDPASVAQAQQWGQLRDVLEQNLTDLQVFRFGTINITTLVVGRTAAGDLAGVLSAVVET